MTIKEIAKLAGVSISTVSKIVNEKDQHINPQTRARVMQIVKEYNYTPYGSVKNIASARTFLLGVLLRRLPAHTHLLDGILTTAQAQGYGIVLLDSREDLLLERRHIESLCRSRVDGVLWEPVGADSARHANIFAGQGIPVLSLGEEAVGPSCRIDYAAMGYTLAQKLVEYGHTRIACLLRENDTCSEQVLEGYRRCLFENGIPYDPRAQLTGAAPEQCVRLLENQISGIVSAHFADACELYVRLMRLHYHIPEDFSIVSLKSSLAERFSAPPVSGMFLPYHEFGRFVCEKLIDHCENAEVPLQSGLFAPDMALSSEETVSVPPFLRAKKIVVVGSIHTDFTFNVDHFPQSGKTTTVLSSVTEPGGKGVNQAVGAARLGHQVALIGEIGSDTYSPVIMNLLDKERVSTEGIHRDMTQPTGTAYIYIEESGDSTVTVQAGANRTLSPDRVRNQPHLFEKAGYCLLSTEIPMETILETAAAARRNNVKLIVKPAAQEAIPEELYRQIDILAPNRKEAAVLCPGCTSLREQAEYLIQKGISTVIITLGEEGCYLMSGGKEQYFPAADFIAVDTTGGADAFLAALASYLLDDYPLEKAIRVATYAAGFCISRLGAVAGMVDRSTLETYIRKVEPELL